MTRLNSITEEEARLRGVINSLELKATKLEILLMDVKTDLLMRGREDFEGVTIVNLSFSIWLRIKKAVNKGIG